MRETTLDPNAHMTSTSLAWWLHGECLDAWFRHLPCLKQWRVSVHYLFCLLFSFDLGLGSFITCSALLLGKVGLTWLCPWCVHQVSASQADPSIRNVIEVVAWQGDTQGDRREMGFYFTCCDKGSTSEYLVLRHHYMDDMSLDWSQCSFSTSPIHVFEKGVWLYMLRNHTGWYEFGLELGHVLNISNM